jgi:hypothetical protein
MEKKAKRKGRSEMTPEQLERLRERQKADAKARRDRKKKEKEGGKASKASAEEDKHDKRAREVSERVSKSSLGEEDAAETLERIRARRKKLKNAEAALANVSKRTAEEIRAAKDQLEAAFEEPVGAEDNGAKARKLDRVTDANRALKTAVSEGAEARAKAKKARKSAIEAFDRACEEADSKQLDLPHTKSKEKDEDGED